MNGDLKQTFVAMVLKEYLESVMEGMRQAAVKQKVGITGKGINSLAYNVLNQGNGAVGKLSFEEYLRFVDMGVGKGSPIGGIAEMREKIKTKGTKRRKSKKIYSKTAYGKLSWLQGRLLYGYTEETVAMLKSQISNQA